MFRPQEISPHYPWSIAWRDGRIPQATADFLEIAQDTGTARAWRDFDVGSQGQPWLPPDDPVALELGLSLARWSSDDAFHTAGFRSATTNRS